MCVGRPRREAFILLGAFIAREMERHVLICGAPQDDRVHKQFAAS